MIVNTSQELEIFGQSQTPFEQLGAMARSIAAGIDGGNRPARVGFAWYRAQRLVERGLVREVRVARVA